MSVWLIEVDAKRQKEVPFIVYKNAAGPHRRADGISAATVSPCLSIGIFPKLASTFGSDVLAGSSQSAMPSPLCGRLPSAPALRVVLSGIARVGHL